MSFPKLTHRTEADGEKALTPVGWTQRLYKLNPGPFHFAKSTLDLSDDLFIETAQVLEGALRVDGKIDSGRLLIGIYEKDEEYRLLNTECVNRAMTVSYDGSRWDVVAVAPGRGVTLHAAQPVADLIIPVEQRDILAQRMATEEGPRSLLLPVTGEADTLVRTMKQCLRLARHTELDSLFPGQLGWIQDDLIEMAAAVIDEIAGVELLNDNIRGERRASIAQEIENILWDNSEEDPESVTSIEDFVSYFGCSRRTIQLAIKEQFGMNFTSLKRLIRLHQVHAAMTGDRKANDVSAYAIAHGFNHLGYFSGYYRQMYGVSPSETLRARRKR